MREWRDRADRRPLILRGARQVGKTTAVMEFGREYDVFLHLNLEKKGDRELFEISDNPKKVLDIIFLHLEKSKGPGTTLLFIDEIQNSPRAIAMLRYFYEELPDIHVIAAGSLLESLVDLHLSFPVGRVEYMAMRPCAFIEFLDGVGKQFDANVISDLKADAIHDRLMEEFTIYMVVGGMPAIINEYAKHHDLFVLERLYESLLTSYRDDAEKYAHNESQRRILAHILTVGWADAAETISFEGFGASRFKSREVSEAMQVLQRAMLMEMVYPVVEARSPLLPNLKRRPKLIWLDTGLVNYRVGMRREFFGNQDIMDVWRGRIGEQVVAQELIAYNHNVMAQRFFWAKDKAKGNAEVDFVIQYRDKVVPIEVKTGHNSKLKSLHSFMDTVEHDVAIRVWNQPYSIDEITTAMGKRFRLLNLPFYYISQIEKILDKLFDTSLKTSGK